MDGVLVLALVLMWLLLALPVAIVICLVIRRADERRPANRVIDDSVLSHLDAPYRPLATRDRTPAAGTAAHHTSPDEDVRDAPPDQTTRRPSAR